MQIYLLEFMYTFFERKTKSSNKMEMQLSSMPLRSCIISYSFIAEEIYFSAQADAHRIRVIFLQEKSLNKMEMPSIILGLQIYIFMQWISLASQSTYIGFFIIFNNTHYF